MKKLLAFVLVCALALTPAAPALAAEFYVDGQTAPVIDLEGEDFPEDLWEWDEAAAYEAAHPEEIAALDQDALLAGWGYRDKTAAEQFLEEYGYDSTVEEAVTIHYIDNRLTVEGQSELAQAYREQYPQEWAGFDADAYYQNSLFNDSYFYNPEGKAAYCAEWNILTEEEFADDMFVFYIEGMRFYGDDGDYSCDEGERELVLMVNGKADSAAVTAENGVSYVDAADLRAILGEEAVAADATGPVAVRPAAEAAGWDVAWYDGSWGESEIQLWDRAAFVERWSQEFQPLNDLLEEFRERERTTLTAQEPLSGKVSLDVALTRFSTLDGDREYKLTMTADYVERDGVLDVTATFDLSQLLQMVSAGDLDLLRREAGLPSPEQLAALLKGGKAEFILDLNQGVVAYNIPLLALVDKGMDGWCVEHLNGWDAGAPEGLTPDPLTAAYERMLDAAARQYGGGAYAALTEYQGNMEAMTLLLGKDRFTTQGGKTVYSLDAETVNRALARAMEPDGQEEAEVSFFRSFDVTCTLSGEKMDLELRVRPDVEGVVEAALSGSENFAMRTLIGGILGLLDVEFTVQASGRQGRVTAQVGVHQNNRMRLEANLDLTAQPTDKIPRQIGDLDVRTEIYGPYDPDGDPQPDLGIIGGADGPTTVIVTAAERKRPRSE